MAGKLQKLKNEYSATLNIRAPEAGADGEIGTKDPLETVDAISYFRYSRPQEERDRKHHHIGTF